MHWILVILMLIIGTNIFAYPKEGTFNREELRQSVPVAKMKENLEKASKEKIKQPEKVIDVFGVKKGETVADIGAGTGFYSFRLAARVGAEGKVFAVEIEDELLKYIRDKMDKNNVTNIIPVKSSDSGPNLPPASCDKIIVTNCYYYFKDPVMFMENTLKALKPGGLVAIVDLDKAKVSKKNKNRDKLSLPGEIVEEMKSAGLVLFESHDFLSTRFFLLFRVHEVK